MGGVNKVILIGNLGGDPEIRYTPAGVAVANFSIATSEDWKDKDTGEKRSKVEWHHITAFRRLAEVCGEYLSKGSKIYVEGKLQTDNWEKDGVTRYKTSVIIHIMQMLGNRNEGAERDPQDRSRQDEPQGDQSREHQPQGNQSQEQKPAMWDQDDSDFEDEDIPF